MTLPSFRGVSKFSSVNTADIFVIGHTAELQRHRIDVKACSFELLTFQGKCGLLSFKVGLKRCY